MFVSILWITLHAGVTGVSLQFDSILVYWLVIAWCQFPDQIMTMLLRISLWTVFKRALKCTLSRVSPVFFTWNLTYPGPLSVFVGCLVDWLTTLRGKHHFIWVITKMVSTFSLLHPSSSCTLHVWLRSLHSVACLDMQQDKTWYVINS